MEVCFMQQTYDDKEINELVMECEDENQEVVLNEKATKELSVLLKENSEKAKEYIADEDKLEKLIRKLEEKLKEIPKIGEALAIIPTYLLLLNSYRKKEYTEIPVGSLLAIIGALLYLISRTDLIPDSIPLAGYLDDIGIVALSLKWVSDDVEEYKIWRKLNKATK
ncbi:MAG: YkvA family protein [Clostridia bacterium]